MQLLIGLCAECDANIVLRDSVTNKMIHIVTVKGSSVTAAHGLPMWRSVKIEKDSQMPNRNAMRLEVIPKLSKSNLNPVWAIANIRECPPKGVYVLNFSIIRYTCKDCYRHNYKHDTYLLCNSKRANTNLIFISLLYS